MKIPLARDAIMLGVNQGIIMVLAVVVIGGLVGSGGLGYEVAQGLGRGQFGQGVLASIAILCARHRARPRHAGPTRAGRRSDVVIDSNGGGQDDSMRVGQGLVVAWSLALAVGVAASRLGGAGGQGEAQCGTVTLNEQAWAGSTANTYVVKYVLEKNLGCKVKITKITEVPVYQAMADGKTDAVLEDWGHIAQQQAVRHQAEDGRRRRLERRHRRDRLVHPDVPDEAVPAVQDVEGPEGQGDASSRARSRARRGCSSAATPRTQQKDRTLIKALGLNLKFVSVGAEPAQVARWSSSTSRRSRCSSTGTTRST